MWCTGTCILIIIRDVEPIMKIADYWSRLIGGRLFKIIGRLIGTYRLLICCWLPTPAQFSKGQSGKQYYRNIIEIKVLLAEWKENPKEAWKTINNVLGRQSKPTVVNELKIGENSLTNAKDIAEGFNDYFSNIGPNLASKIDTSLWNICQEC